MESGEIEGIPSYCDGRAPRRRKVPSFLQWGVHRRILVDARLDLQRANIPPSPTAKDRKDSQDSRESVFAPCLPDPPSTSLRTPSKSRRVCGRQLHRVRFASHRNRFALCNSIWHVSLPRFRCAVIRSSTRSGIHCKRSASSQQQVVSRTDRLVILPSQRECNDTRSTDYTLPSQSSEALGSRSVCGR